MTISLRKLAEAVKQGSDESIIYEFDMANWGTPVSPTQALVDLTDVGSDASSKFCTSVITATGCTIATAAIASLTVDHTYRLTIGAHYGSSIKSGYLEIEGE